MIAVVLLLGCASDDESDPGANDSATNSSTSDSSTADASIADSGGGEPLDSSSPPDDEDGGISERPSVDAGIGGPDASAEVEASCTLTDWERMMLEAHNQWRASVDPPAAGMLRVHWDPALAAHAAAWIQSCDPDWPHSSIESRSNVAGYEILGENLAYCAGSSCNESPAVTDGSGIGGGEGWWEERLDYDWETDTSDGITSHYTQMVSSNVYAIGCATQHCDGPGPFDWEGRWWWTSCLYGPRGQAYWNGTKPYDRGDGGLIDVPTSVFDMHPALCESTR